MFLFEARQKGMPGLPYVVVPHPLGGVREDEIRRRGAASADAVLAALRGPRS